MGWVEYPKKGGQSVMQHRCVVYSVTAGVSHQGFDSKISCEARDRKAGSG